MTKKPQKVSILFELVFALRNLVFGLLIAVSAVSIASPQVPEGPSTGPEDQESVLKLLKRILNSPDVAERRHNQMEWQNALAARLACLNTHISVSHGQVTNTKSGSSFSYQIQNGLSIEVYGIELQLTSDAVPRVSDIEIVTFHFDGPLLPSETRNFSTSGPYIPDFPNLFFVDVDVRDVLDDGFQPRVHGLFYRTFGKLPPDDQLKLLDRQVCRPIQAGR